MLKNIHKQNVRWPIIISASDGMSSGLEIWILAIILQ